MNANGVLWWSTKVATVGLVVQGGIVVDAPPHARRWAMGRPAQSLISQARRFRDHVTLAWIPEERQA